MTVTLTVNLIPIGLSKGAPKSSWLGGVAKESLRWCKRNETWKEGLKTFEKY